MGSMGILLSFPDCKYGRYPFHPTRRKNPLRVEVLDRRALKQELEDLKDEMSIEGIELSEACLKSLHPDAISARAYVRAGQRRIRDMTRQLVCGSRVWGWQLAVNKPRN